MLLRGTAAEIASLISSCTQLRCRVILPLPLCIFMRISGALPGISSKLQIWSAISQGKLAAIEDLVGQRNWREFDHQFSFLFLVKGFGGKVGPATNGKEPSKIELASGKQQKANPCLGPSRAADGADTVPTERPWRLLDHCNVSLSTPRPTNLNLSTLEFTS